MSKDKYPRIFSQPNWGYCVYYPSPLKIGEYINNSLHLARKYARIFIRGHYLFREANSFPRAKLEENCELRGTDNVQGQYPSIFSQPNWGCCVYYPSVLKIGEYPRIFPSFSWGIFAHVTRLDQSRASENIWWIITEDIPSYGSQSKRAKIAIHWFGKY